MATYSQNKHSRRKELNPVRIILSLIGSLLLILFLFPLLFKNIAVKSGFVLWQASSRFSSLVESSRFFFLRNETLRKENDALKEEVQQLTLAQSLSQNTTIEVVEDGILLPVVAKPFKSGSDTIILRTGENNLEKYQGKITVTPEGVPVGYVSRISPPLMYVKLFSYKGEKVTLREKNSGIDFELIGRASGNFYLEANQDVPIDVGAFLYLPGISTYPVARISKVISREHDPEKTYLATLVVNYNTFDFLKITDTGYELSN